MPGLSVGNLERLSFETRQLIVPRISANELLILNARLYFGDAGRQSTVNLMIPYIYKREDALMRK